MKLLGQRLMARDFDRQVAEIQVRIAILNGYARAFDGLVAEQTVLEKLYRPLMTRLATAPGIRSD